MTDFMNLTLQEIEDRLLALEQGFKEHLDEALKQKIEVKPA